MKKRSVTAAVVVAGAAGLVAWLIASAALGAAAGVEDPTGADPTSPSQEAMGFEWFWAINGPVSADAVGDMSVDDEGSVFLAGGHGGLDLDRDGVVDLASGSNAYVGAGNPFFMKLSRGPSDDRVRLRWTRSPSTPADRSGTTIAADNRGGAYISGAFAETVAFEGGPVLQGAGGNDGYIARYDAEGSIVWARVFGGPGSDAIYRVVADREGNVYAAGVGAGTFPIDGGGTFRAESERAAVLVSYDEDGALRWTRILGSGVPFATGLAMAPDGTVYVTGELDGAADLDGDGAIDLPAPRDRDGFVARFDSEGDLVGTWTTGVLTAPMIAPDGDVYLGSAVGGQMEQRYGAADFDGDGRPDVTMKGAGPTAAVIARYSPEGDLRWVRSYDLESPGDLAIRGDRLVMSGNYHGVRDLDEDGIPEAVDRTVDPQNETDLAILLLSATDGRPEVAWTAPGPGNDWANAVAFSPTEPSLYVAGSIQLTADFTGDGEFGEGWAVCENLGDVFFAQYHIGEQRQLVLEASLAERQGRLEGDLVWSGASTTDVDVYREGVLITATANDGEHTDVIQRRPGVLPPYRYRVCESGTSICSNTVAADF